MYIVMSLANRDKFSPFLAIHMLFIYFSCLIALARLFPFNASSETLDFGKNQSLHRCQWFLTSFKKSAKSLLLMGLVFFQT